jgi:hypothetical protein
MNNLHAIDVKYLPATNSRSSRVKIYSQRFGSGIVIPYDYALNSIEEMAENALIVRGFNLIGVAEVRGGSILLSDTFKKIEKKIAVCPYCNDDEDTTKADSRVLSNGLCVYHNFHNGKNTIK